MKHILLLVLLSCGISTSAQHAITFRIRNGQNAYLRKLNMYRQPYKDKLGTTDSTGAITISGLKSGDTLTIAYGECPTYAYIVPEPVPTAPVEIQLQCMFLYVEERAEFPGGRLEWNKFLTANFKYPEQAIAQKIEGKVYVRFLVDAEGNISDARITRPIPNCPECSQEVLRLVGIMPKWKPSIQKGSAVKSYFDLPIVFSLD